jgi:hypothetical protein
MSAKFGVSGSSTHAALSNSSISDQNCKEQECVIPLKYLKLDAQPAEKNPLHEQASEQHQRLMHSAAKTPQEEEAT